jgi:phosphatidylglycerophosphatase A
MKKEELFTTCFGLGRLPIAPGTWGSLLPVVAYQVLAFLYPVANPLIQGLLFFYGVWVCIHYVPRIIELTGHEDPGQVVADEVAGQSIPMFVLSVITPMHICNAAIMGFALFRIFDILKPWPCKRLEMLPSGWGVVADDVMAGVYAAAVSAVFIRLLPGIFG